MLPKFLAVHGLIVATFAIGDPARNPVVELGPAGTYMGVSENHGTVQSWKGISYAQPPLGDLRFMPPNPLPPQPTGVFSLAPYGVHNAYLGPGSLGTEDCLKLYVWKLTTAKKGDKLAVVVFVHGGGLIFGSAAQDDFGDWVSHDQNFIAVSLNYRLGILGFLNHPEQPSANAGLLDQRMAMRWVKENIAAFGGNPDGITIMGQSGGGWAILAHLVLYDGCHNGTFQKAIVRSAQREPMFNIKELKLRNEALFNHKGKLANVPTIAGSTSDEGFDGYLDAHQRNPTPRNTTRLDPSTNRITNLTDEHVNKIATFYKVNATYGSTAQDNFFLNSFRAYLMAFGLFGEVGIFGSERLVGRWMSAKHGPQNVWTYRFNAPTVGTKYGKSLYPLAPVQHSAENSYLDSPLSSMTRFKRAIAAEFRSYISSFIRTGNSNTYRLDSAPFWPCYGGLGDFFNSPVRLVTQFAFSSNTNKTYSTSTQIEAAQKAGLERTGYWQTDESIRF
ncbi:Carboxylic ester hydrolase [Fusarium keratoplasticum]|uniref:Carboxylic ester hydrolase n=1 Tax=Fusarium keratoplasticum TaxID=1328300 RepID=A0ACC0RAM7_9HYPO|nr:Carboxylic ester hydrolase [Fusarium keratoplasticum]KAI8680496.1 Carboxylic ester hydrolase [Fusarium keratoplasticum]